MLLVTGGLGFIGSHTTRELLTLGEECLVVQRHVDRVPDFLAPELDAGLGVQALDIGDLDALLALGERRPIGGIVHLAAPAMGAGDAVQTWREAMNGLANVVTAAREWKVRRVVVASTIGVYAGLPDGAFAEDRPLPLTGPHEIPSCKKCFEIFSDLVANQMQIDIANVRIGAIWGPLGQPRSPFFALPEMVHAVTAGESFDGSARPVHAQAGIDSLYVRDCARAIALLQAVDHLADRVYNVGGGRATSNGEVAAAIRHVIPEAEIKLAPGPAPGAPPAAHMPTERLERDTGYRAAFTLGEGIGDYVDWLRAGHER